MGRAARRSRATRPASSSADSANEPSTQELVQPRAGPSMMPKTSAPSPSALNAVDSASTLGEEGSRDSGSRNRQAAMPTAAIGMLIRKIEPHQ